VRDAAIHRPQEASQFYPPRERWYGRLWYPWHFIKQKLCLGLVFDGFELPLYKLLLGITLPGVSWLWYGRRIFSLVTITCYCLLVITFLIWIGYPAGTIPLAILMSIHTSSILYMNRRLTPRVELWKRIVWTLVVFGLVNLFVYQPLRRQMERRWFRPLLIGDRVLVVDPGVPPVPIKKGDWVAYQINSSRGDQTWVRAGYGVGAVLATAGDKISFQTNGFSINGVLQPRRDFMPAKGDLVVADGSWFIWPGVAITGHGNVGAYVTENAMTQLAMVPKSNYIGVLFHHWWWRSQTLP
jgi:hypothetical protein